MREIKFRAWDKQDKKMYYLDIFTMILDSGNKWSFWDAFCEPYMETVFKKKRVVTNYKNAELMQFTGLKDKNGKEIYEGDIVTTGVFRNLSEERVERRFVVEWLDSGMWGFKNTTFLFNPKSEQEMYKVIGNIYENPELLNET